MTDHELIELAAKAAGVELCWPLRFVKTKDGGWSDDTYEKLPQPHVLKNGFVGGPWNPLINDGDALRLAVRLQILGPQFVSEHAECPYAATRRAIVRAAAALANPPSTPPE